MHIVKIIIKNKNWKWKTDKEMERYLKAYKR